MKINNLKFPLSCLAIIIGGMSAVNAATVSIENPGFEDDFSGWTDTDPSSISTDERSGSNSAKISGSGGKFEQDVSVDKNTDYELTAYIKGYGKIGATVDGTRYTRTGGDDDEYELVTVSFNSGSSTSITIFGNYYDDEGRFDDFALKSTSSSDSDSDSDSDSGSDSDSESTGSTEFDWDGWKVTMPVNGETYYNDGNTSSAAELLPSGCSEETFDSSLSNDYFWSDSEGLHFKVPMNLDGKTPNTSYIRSELRELYNWSPCDSTSTANWSYGGDHTLEATLRIDDYNKSSTKVVVGQIHGHDIDYATIKLHWEGDDKPIRVIYNEKPSSSSSEDVDLGYVDSSGFWSYTIKMTDDGIELTAGGVTKTLEFGDELSNDWKDEDFYFKAGLYPQEKPDEDSDDVYEATFSDVVVSH